MSIRQDKEAAGAYRAFKDDKERRKALCPDGHPNSPTYGHLKLPHLN